MSDPTEAPVTVEIVERVATITMNDGKANALSPRMQAHLHEALDRAEQAQSAVVLAGKPGTFSGGFDLKILRAGGQESVDMVRGGFELSLRLLSFPTPVVMACTGHAVAMGAFLLLSGDHLVGGRGPYQLRANEVALGITMPYAAIEVVRNRLTPAAFQRAVDLAATFGPDDAVASGWLDAIADDPVATAQGVAAELQTLPPAAHAATKLRTRAVALDAIRAGMERDGNGPLL